MSKTTTDRAVDIVRLNINVNSETAAALRKLADERGISITEAVRRAIAVFDYLEDERDHGRKIQTSDANNRNVKELVLL